ERKVRRNQSIARPWTSGIERVGWRYMDIVIGDRNSADPPVVGLLPPIRTLVQAEPESTGNAPILVQKVQELVTFRAIEVNTDAESSVTVWVELCRSSVCQPSTGQRIKTSHPQNSHGELIPIRRPYRRSDWSAALLPISA